MSRSPSASNNTVMITGGLGFIGSALTRYWMNRYPEQEIVILDAETYAARPGAARSFELAGVKVERVDIRDHAAVARAMRRHEPDHVIHLAAESHVCRSIAGPKVFYETNVMGTFHLLEEFKELWRGREDGHHFHHVSTDEVFGELGPDDPAFTEQHPLLPRSPYSSSKAASDMMALTFFETYGLHVTVSNCSNNFGPNQHAEKLIPRAIAKAVAKEPMTVYGNGLQVRDWLWVDDHCYAIDLLLHHGKAGERYCVGGEKEMTNLDMLVLIKQLVDQELGQEHKGCQFKYTNDRPTDDFRYAIDNTKIRAELGFEPSEDFQWNLRKTIRWYLEREIGL